MAAFYVAGEHEWQDLGGGVKRKIMSWNDDLMTVAVCFEKEGSIGTPHSHEGHTQIGYIAAGSFKITVGAETRVLKAGDSYFAGKNDLHGAVALEENSVILDIFTPKRADFLTAK